MFREQIAELQEKLKTEYESKLQITEEHRQSLEAAKQEKVSGWVLTSSLSVV